LVSQGVRFDVCMNTVDTIELKTGRAPQLNPNAQPVEAGVAQILALTEKGYTLVRP
jgi:intracellular sulfur oxidation DsrE/DsrF family protein